MGIDNQLQPGEMVLYRAHVTLLSLFPGLAAIVVLVSAALIAHFMFGQLPAAAIAMGLALLIALVVGWKYMLLRANQYIVTNHRVIRQTGLLSVSSMDSRLDKVNNVEHRQTLMGRMLGYGDVEIDTASEGGRAVFADISNPLGFKHAIVQAAEGYRGSLRSAPLPGVAAAAPSGAERLRELKALHDDGLISDAEFEAKRKELVAHL